MPTFEFSYLPERCGGDTIVFVHGLVGDRLKTWGKFPQLLRTDPDLPQVDLLMCGYKSRLLRWDPDIGHAGRRLVSELEIQVDEEANIFLVGHSMGGLVILSGLVDALRDGHAQARPCRNVAWITLFATPVMGSQAAAVYKHILWLLRFVPNALLMRLLESRQVAGLARGASIDTLIREVIQRLYLPHIEEGDKNSKRAISVRAVVGDEDQVVTETSAQGVFHTPPPLRVSGTHTTLKEPTDHDDSRYRALKNDLAKYFSPSFAKLCSRCVSGDKEAEAVFFHIWRIALRERIASTWPEHANAEEQHRALGVIAWKLSAVHPDLPPGDVLNLAVVYLSHLQDVS